MSTGQRLAILVHRACEHVASVCNPPYRGELERLRDELAAVGQHGWRVQVREVSDKQLLSVLGSGCSTCRIGLTNLGVSGD